MSSIDELFPPPMHRSRGRVARLLSSYEKAKGVAHRYPEVMIKISGSIKNSKHLQEAMNYIARNGELEAENQSGEKLQGKEECLAQMQDWQRKQGITEQDAKYAQAKRIVLSMPKGTDSEGFKKACKQWAKHNLENYDYVLAYHIEGEDSRTKQPHCHILVRTIGKDGKRFRVSNAQRDEWREDFAKCLQKEGILANATRRWSRDKDTKGISQEEHHASKRRQKTDKERARDHAIARKKKQLAARRSETRAKTRALASSAIREFSKSDYQDDLKIASGLYSHYFGKSFDIEKVKHSSIAKEKGLDEKSISR